MIYVGNRLIDQFPDSKFRQPFLEQSEHFKRLSSRRPVAHYEAPVSKALVTVEDIAFDIGRKKSRKFAIIVDKNKRMVLKTV